MLGSWNYTLNTLPQTETQNRIKFDNGALQSHIQAGNDRNEMLNSIKTMLEYNPNLDTSLADDELPEFNSKMKFLNSCSMAKTWKNSNQTTIQPI